MTRSLSFVLLMLLIATVPVVVRAENALRAGAAAVDVTPQEFPLNMPGGFSANAASGAHDPFHARALVLTDDATTVALVVVDNLGVAPEVLDEAKQIAAAATGMSMAKMLISSTHTHSGPSSNSGEASGPVGAYRKRLVDGIARSIIDAHAEPAELHRAGSGS